MPDNATISQALQIGMQSVFGTPVVATKKLITLGVDVDMQLETDTYFPNGSLFPSSTGLVQEWVEGDLSGILTYTEVVYPLSMLLGAGTITAVGTNGKQWKWNPAANAVIVPVLGTLEKGSSVFGVRLPDIVMTGFNIGWSRTDRVEIGGSVMGQRITQPYTPTAALSSVATVRVMPPQIDVYFDPSWATLGTTKQLRAFECSFSLDGLWGAIWPLNSALVGHDGYIPLQPSSESTMLVMADTAGMAFLANVRAGTVGYLRIKATGPALPAPDGAFNYLFQVDLPVQVQDVGTFEDSNGVYAIPWTFQPINDGVNAPLTITVINLLAAL